MVRNSRSLVNMEPHPLLTSDLEQLCLVADQLIALTIEVDRLRQDMAAPQSAVRRKAS